MRPPPSVDEFKEHHWPLLRDRLPAEKVVIFGSQLHGGRDKSSDLDLIIVASCFEDLDGAERISLVREVLKAEYSLDVFYYTPQEFQHNVAERGMIAEAVRDGVLLEAKRQEESQAFALFERKWKEMTGRALQILHRPEPPDFLCEEDTSGRKVAVEVTSLFLDASTPEERKRIAWERFLARELRPSLRGKLPGTFMAHFGEEDRPHSWRPEETLHELQQAILSAAPSLGEGEHTEISHPCRFRLQEVSDRGARIMLYGFTRVYLLSERAFAGMLELLVANKNSRLKGEKEKGHATILLVVDGATTSVAEEELLESPKLVCPAAYSNLDYVFLVRLQEKEVIQFLPVN